MRLLALVLVAACGATDDGVVGPRAPAVLQLVGCEPALAPPTRALVGGRAEGAFAAAAAERREGQVSFGMPSTGGAIDTGIVRRTLLTKLPELRGCYEAELARSRQGRIHMAWRLRILQDGRVQQAMPVAHATGPMMTVCVTRTLRSMVFPPRTTGGSRTITIPFVFEPAPIRVPAADTPVRAHAWTPFPPVPGTHGPGAMRAARVTEAAVHARRDALAACFPPAGPTGSLRALLELDAEGKLVAVRAGGLGARSVEACVERALDGLTALTPVRARFEVACDLARGDAQRWRVAPASGYGVIEASRTHLTYGATRLEPGARDPEPLRDAKTFLVLAERDTPGMLLALALVWANDGEGAIIALRDGARPPRYVGMGRVAVSEIVSAERPPWAAMQLGARTVTACSGRATQHAALDDAAAVSALVQRLAHRCKTVGCGPTLRIGLEPDATAGDLDELTGAARRAGFARVLIGGEAVCDVTGPAHDDDGDDEAADA